jgi:hypothetical protein
VITSGRRRWSASTSSAAGPLVAARRSLARTHAASSECFERTPSASASLSGVRPGGTPSSGARPAPASARPSAVPSSDRIVPTDGAFAASSRMPAAAVHPWNRATVASGGHVAASAPISCVHRSITSPAAVPNSTGST